LKTIKERIKNSFVLQRDQSDCGVSCLASLLAFYGSNYNLESLRLLSGTSPQGTTLLGLYEAANQLGFRAEGYEATLEALKGIQAPVILHVIVDNELPHYVVCYYYHAGAFCIGDPAKGITFLAEDQLVALWKTNMLLQLEPDHIVESRTDSQKPKRQWFKHLLREDLSLLVAILVLGIILTSLSLATAVFSQKLIDNILPSESNAKLVGAIVLFALVMIIRTVLGYIRNTLIISQARDLNVRLLDAFFNALLFLPKSFFDSRKTGDLTARMNDTLRIQRLITQVTGTIVIDMLMILVSAAAILVYLPEAALIVVLFIPVYWVAFAKFNPHIVTHQHKVLSAYAANESNYIDTLQGMSEIKSTGKEFFFKTVTHHVFSYFQRCMYELGNISNRYNLFIELAGALFIVSMMSFLSYQVLHKHILIGELVAMLTLTGNIIPALSRLVISNVQIQEARMAFERMYEFSTLPPETSAADPNTGVDEFKSLHIESVAFRYPGRKPVLADITLALHAGELVALLGESGSGKSTILQLILRFYPVSSGTIKMNGEAIDAFPLPAWRSCFGVVHQDPKIFNTSLLENLSLSTEQNAGDVIAFCKHFGFHRYFAAFPQGYSTILGEHGSAISGGQKQLVALARALYKRPKILLLDEATSALDRVTENFIMDLLLSLRKDIAILMVTHRIKTAAKADRIYIIHNGEVSQTGTPDQLITSENLFSDALREHTSY
jgi:ATP-binding cassette subfamily B protein